MLSSNGLRWRSCADFASPLIAVLTVAACDGPIAADRKQADGAGPAAPSAMIMNAGAPAHESPATLTPPTAATSTAQATPPAPLDKGPNAVLEGLPAGEAQRKALCERAQREARADRVVDSFCAPTPPEVRSIQELQKVLDIAFDEEGNGPSFALNSHSASLSVRSTSAINPRAVFMSGFFEDDGLTMAYTRGEQAVEIIARDRTSDLLNFYFATYEQACNADHSCAPGDLFTPATESGWTEFSIYSEQDLENTVFDCNTCHRVQDDEGESRLIMRFQELQNPWTHWFRDNNTGGRALISDYRAAHGDDETYAGIPGDRIQDSEPALLQAFVTFKGFANQPNEFRTGTIEGQVRASSEGQPAKNDQPGESEAWTRLQERFLTGDAIPVPYHDVKVTDSRLLAEKTQAYVQFRSSGSAKELPDLRRVYREDRLHEMAGMRIDPTLKDQALVTAACSQCHNSQLNPSITRARFNVELSKFSDLKGGVLAGDARDLQLGVTIRRLKLPAHDTQRMPPERVRELTPVQIENLVAYFCSQMQVKTEECR